MVRTRPGSFVQEVNRINVGITRAKHGLVIVGNARTLKKDDGWRALLDKHRENVVQGFEGARQWIDQEYRNKLNSLTTNA